MRLGPHPERNKSSLVTGWMGLEEVLRPHEPRPNGAKKMSLCASREEFECTRCHGGDTFVTCPFHVMGLAH